MFKEISIEKYKDNIVTEFKNNKALLTAGTLRNYNMMTVSWGGVGELWNDDCIFCFVRPQRYTFSFMEENDYFSLTFFGGDENKALAFCGSKSGRDFDKAKETGLIPFDCGNAVSFKSAKTIFVCRKLAFLDFDPDKFIDDSIDDVNYEHKDYHRMYIGKIEKILVK